MNFDRAARHQACGYNRYLLRALSLERGDSCTDWFTEFDAAARHQARGHNRYLLRAPGLERGDSCTDWFTKFDSVALTAAMIIYSTPRAMRGLRMILNLGWK
jgi:hypothetical protein